MVCSTRVFDDVGTSAGRGVGGRVACPRPLPWRYPSGFAGVFFATVLGLVVGWLERCLLVVAVWPWWVSMELGIRVFDDVGGLLAEVWVVLLVVVGVDGVGYVGVRGCGRVC